MVKFRLGLLLTVLSAAVFTPKAWSQADAENADAKPAELKILFLGDNGHHRPADRFAELAPVLDDRGIHMQYTDNVDSLTRETLNQFDGLVLYANIDRISKPHADALLEYVQEGHGFIPLHCATYCFRNDPRIVALMGAQFQRHGTGTFSTEIAEPDHPIMQGFQGFRSWDETYIHTLHNEKNRTVLEYRAEGDQAEGNEREPWTWVRTEGKGRVFYTAWGHDTRTWTNPGFVTLVDRGIRWACGSDNLGAIAATPGMRAPFQAPEMTKIPQNLKPFEYVDVGAEIPNYVPDARWGTQAEPLHEMQQPLPPEESIKHYVTPTGFHLALFVSEPDLVGKPIAMNWDERGRLWVCETVDYPNELRDDNQGRDRIRICEDTDGDGRADKFTVFAEDLSIPTSIIFHRGAAIVQNGTQTLWLKDTDGDDKADRREVILTGWNLRDTHGGVSNFRYGIDNWFWAMQGYNRSRPENAEGETQTPFAQGFWRFKLDDQEPPLVTDVEFIRSTDNNTWGLGISEEGLIFGSTANRNPSDYMPIANRYYERVRGWGPETLRSIADTYLFKPITDKVRQVDQHGGYTAGAGHALYTGRNYPEQWWNRTAFVCGPTGKLVGTFVLNAEGADFSSTSPINLVASNDEWSAPIMAEVGPDGNVWILDWYNYIVQHNPTPQGFETGKGAAYETKLRDKTHGRIYRLLYNGNADQAASPNWDRVDLGKADSAHLVQALTSPTMLQRLHAQRLLLDKNDASVIPALIKLVQDEELDAAGLNVGAIHALWVLHGMQAINDEHGEVLAAVQAATQHPSAGVRRNAIQVLPEDSDVTREVLASNELWSDDYAQVRLAGLLKLSDSPVEGLNGELTAKLFGEREYQQDRWLRDGLTAAAAADAPTFLTQVAQAEIDVPANGNQRGRNSSQDVIVIVAEHFARSRPDSESVNHLISSWKSADDPVVQATLTGLIAGWPQDHTLQLSDSAEERLIDLVVNAPSQTQGQLVRIAIRLGSKKINEYAGKIVEQLLATIGNNDARMQDRIDAAQQLIGLKPEDSEVVSELLGTISPQTAPELADGLIESLENSTASNVGEALMELIPTVTPSTKQAAIRVLLARPETTNAFLDAVEAGQMQLSELSLDQKRNLSEHPNRRIARRADRLLSAGGGLPNPDRQKVIDELLPLAQETGNLELGKAVFTKHCSKCHRHGDIGESIGPNLTGMAVHPKDELLVQIMDPSRSVEGNFRSYTVVTTEGRILTGMLAAETRTSIELVDTEAKRLQLSREDIEQLIGSNKSLMPEGFEKQMTGDDLKNLLEFLTAKGRYLPLDLVKGGTISSATPMFFGRDPGERMIFEEWGQKKVHDVPFLLVDPQGGRVINTIMLYGPLGAVPEKLPRRVNLPVNAPASMIHMLGGIGGWSFPYSNEKTVSATVRIHYADGTQEDHDLINGVHIADYINRVDVPESEFAFNLRGHQLRYLKIPVGNQNVAIQELEIIKGNDATAPIIMGITIEAPEEQK